MKKKSKIKISKNKKEKAVKTLPNKSYSDREVGNGIMRMRREISVQKKKEILQIRSRELAEKSKEEYLDTEYFEVVEFILSFETYAIESSYVGEVYSLKDFTHVPCTPSFVLGITNVRGRIISVIDIRKFFNLPERGLTNLNRVIVVHTPDMELGILADSIKEVRLLSRKAIQPTPPTLMDIGSEFLQGVTEDCVIVLDVRKILCDSRIIVHQEVEA